MQVHVKLYASLRRYRPELAIGQAFECAVPDDITVGHLVDRVLRLPNAEVAIVLVNGVHSERERPLSDGDQIALWPPIAGGAVVATPSARGISERRSRAFRRDRLKPRFQSEFSSAGSKVEEERP